MIFKRLIATLLLGLISTSSFAQDLELNEQSISWSTYYTIEPDYRRCPAPYCGGWWLTKVNTYSSAVGIDTLDSLVAPIIPQRIYVAEINYRALGLSPEEIRTFEYNIHRGRAFIRGVLQPYSNPLPPAWSPLQTLLATGTWLAANDNPAIGPYLNLKSSGIVCITTPCPYYDVHILNTNFRTPAHELNLKRANLTEKQTAQAWRDISEGGLIMTGVKFVSQGMTGTGLGIAATKVFFKFPGPVTGL